MSNYLYNGVSLPPLVGWDGMPPPGIFILHDSRNGTYVLCGVSAAPRCVLVNGEDEPALPFDVFGTVFVATEGAESWGENQNFKPLEYFSTTEDAYVRQRNVGWLWTQSDILTADGQNIYMAATAPIKVAEDSGITIDDVRRHYRRGYTAGVIFGRNSGGVFPRAKTEDAGASFKSALAPAAAYSMQARDGTPGNYLYNGVELPPPPSWDGMPPPGIFVVYFAAENTYRIYGLDDVPFSIRQNTEEKMALAADVTGHYFNARSGETRWYGGATIDRDRVDSEFVSDLSDIADYMDGLYILRSENKIIWTKEAIFSADGQRIILAATEPIKIELPEQFTEADLRRSWRRGMALGVVVGVKARKIIAQTQPPSSVWPDDIAPEDEIDSAVDESIKENGGTPIVDKKDKISFNPKGKKYPPVVGYLYDDFQITYYDPVTTEFRAIGWQRGKLVSDGAIAWYGMKEYREIESPGGDYIKDITFCARGALFYNGEKIWPSSYVEPDTPVEPDVPVEPDEPVEADYFLYGTPNESGNVALADGDGYVVYDGIVAPKIEGWEETYSREIPLASADPVAAVYGGEKLPNIKSIYTDEVKKNFPYAFIHNNTSAGGSSSLYCFSEEPGVASKSNLTLLPYDTNNRGQYMHTVWGEGKTNEFGAPIEFIGGLLASVTRGIIWTNFDLRYQGSNEVYFQKSADPIPVYELKE